MNIKAYLKAKIGGGAIQANAPQGPDANPWNAETPKSYSGMWLGCHATQRHINRKISGDPNIGWLQHFWTIHGANAHRESRCLVLGANEGFIERWLKRAGYPGHILATDIAGKALARARTLASAEGWTDIEYRVADLNVDRFEGPFDFIIAEGVLHHIEKTREILAHLEQILAPEGVLFGVEWSGPVRFQLPEQQVHWVNALLGAVPGELRPQYSGPYGWPPSLDYQKQIHFVRTPEADVAKMDPSEAIAGLALRELLPEMFNILQWRGFGGTLLSYMGGHFPFELADTNRYVEVFTEMLLHMEDKVIESGLLADEFFAFSAGRRVVPTSAGSSPSPGPSPTRPPACPDSGPSA